MAPLAATTTTAVPATTEGKTTTTLDDLIDISGLSAVIFLSVIVLIALIYVLTKLPWPRWKKDIARVSRRVGRRVLNAYREASEGAQLFNYYAAGGAPRGVQTIDRPFPKKATMTPTTATTTTTTMRAPAPAPARCDDWVELESGLPTPPPVYSAF